MTAHLLIMYPHPKDVKEFDRAYREEHLPYAAPRLTGATEARGRPVVRAAALSSDLGRELPVDPDAASDCRRGRQGSVGARGLDQLGRRPDDRGRHRRRVRRGKNPDQGPLRRPWFGSILSYPRTGSPS